jgi:hypothetical protein
MGETSKDVLTLLTQLMPGFLTAWVIYGLTTYTKPPQFERVVQALIYSFIVNALVAVLERVLVFVGKFAEFGIWDKSAELIASTVIAIALGLLLSYYMRNDSFFSVARRLRLTNRTPFPSEWYGAFAKRPRYLVLHLTGGRRISGYPTEWPTEPAVGHFRLTDAAWINDENLETPLDGDESILIEAKQVEMVELLKDEKELNDAAEAA